MIDVITVAFRDELSVLRAQAQSLELYAKDLKIQNIYVVVNDESYIAGMIDPGWWGSLRKYVKIFHRSVFSCEYSDNGWLSQQVIKILTAAVSYNTWSMVLDAKTLLVRPMTLDQLIQDNKMQVGTLDIYPVFEKSKDITSALFGIEFGQQLGPGGVPFFFHNATVRAMIAEVESRTHQSFPDWFQAQGMLTEFILYSGYLFYRDHGFDKLYGSNRVGIVTNICHSEVGIFDSKSQQFADSATVSVHRQAWQNLNDQQQQNYKNFLRSRGIHL